MPHYFTCPKCKQKNHGYQYKPEGTSYYDDMYCARCGQKNITWVATQDLVSRVPNPAKDLFAVGSGQSSISYFAPEVAVGDTEKTIAPRMKPNASFVAPFSQGARSTAFTPNVKDVSEGQCAGQSLHWIRKVLQGGRSHYTSPKEKGGITRSDEDLVKKQKKQSVVGAKTHMMLDKVRNSAGREKLAEFDRVTHAYLKKQGFKLEGDQWSFPRDKAILLEKVNAKRTELINKLDNEGFFAVGWEKLARDLDQTLRSLGSSRPFSNIITVKCINRKSTRFGSGTASDFANAVANDVEFKPGRAAFFSVGLAIGVGEAGGSISGHAIAAHYKSASEFYIFDPNIGVFMSTSKDAFRRALTTLMGPVWQQDLGWSLDGSFGYSIFRSTVESAETKPIEKPVTYNSSPKVTAVENHARGAIPTTNSVMSGGGSGGGTRPRNNAKTSSPPQFGPQSPPKIVKTSGGSEKPSPGKRVGDGGNVAELMKKFQK